MDEIKFAQLNNEQLNEIKQLEKKLDVTLIAYDSLVTETNESSILESPDQSTTPPLY